MTQIRVGETVYSLEDSVSGASLGDLYALKVQAISMGSPGVSVKTISESLTRAGELAAVEGFNMLDLLDDAEFILNLAGLAFLARRKAGEHITLQDAARSSFQDVQIIPDEGEDDETPLDVAVEAVV